jgi:hypothetical protein
MKFNKSKTSSLQDFDSQMDWMIEKGIMKSVEQFNDDMVKGKVDMFTDKYNSLSPQEQKSLLSIETKKWWNQYGK